MMRLIFMGMLLLAFVFGAAAQKNAVFRELSWEQAAELAEKEGKVVLVDVMMRGSTPQARQKQDAALQALFSKTGVADFCREHAVAIRMDMLSEEGAAFAPKMAMFMYPAYAFFMPNGDILEVVSPGSAAQNPEELVKAGEKALQAADIKRANSRSIVFEDLTYEEALAKAEKENRLVFIDAYTAWCQPCILMAKHVFTLDKVADFYNRHFINLKLDFSQKKELAVRYKISGYPSFLFLNGKGKLVHVGSGYTSGEDFVACGQQALEKAQGIAFFKGSWEEAQKRAQKENKLIFMDGYTSWCGPCKRLAREVFTDPEVAAFFNGKFVNVKVDMEKGEGLKLKEQYKVSVFPTLHFINAEGTVVHTVVGNVDAATLIRQARKALEGKGLAYLTAEYGKGERDFGFIRDYLQVLNEANLSKQAEQVCIDYLAALGKGKLKEQAYWNLFTAYVNDVHSDLFAYVYEHRNEFCRQYGEEEVRGKIAAVWAVGANGYVQGRGEEAVFDRKGFKKYIRSLAQADVDGKFNIIEDAKMYNAERLGDWKTYVATGSEKLEKGEVSDLLLFNWGLRISRDCQDPALRLKAAGWFDTAVERCIREEAEGKSGMMSYKVYFEKIAGDLKANCNK